MFKKFISFFFEEEDDNEVIVEESLEPVTIKQPLPKKVKATEPVKQQPQSSISTVTTQKSMADIRVETAPKQPTPSVARPQRIIQEEKAKPKSFNIELSRAEGRGEDHPHKRTDKKDFDFSPVISPMFGSKDEVKKGNEDHTTTILRPKKHNPLGIIISPIYGAQELADMEEIAIEEIKEKNNSPVEIIEDNEIKSYSLEEMLVKNENEEVIDSYTSQFSLFGESEIIKEEKENYAIIDE